MRDKNLLQVFLVLNVALGACFVVYLFLSSNSQPKVISTSFPSTLGKTNAASRRAAEARDTNAATPVMAVAVATNPPVESTNQTVVPQAVLSQRKFGWQQMESDEQTKTNEYRTYLESLRAVGCPEEK